MKKIIENFLVKLPRAIGNLGAYTIFALKTVKAIFKKPFPFKECFQQVVKIGYESIGITCLTNFLMGAVLALQAGVNMERLMAGASSNIGAMGVAIVVEIGPVLTAIIVAGKTGSSMAASIGTMKITEQIDALITLSTDPIQYISVPRFLASVFVLPVLIVIADVLGVIGGYLVTYISFEQSIATYMSAMVYVTSTMDVFIGIIKGLFFGGIIATISSYIGFSTVGGAEGVGKSTTKAVVMSSIGILIADLLFGLVYNLSL